MDFEVRHDLTMEQCLLGCWMMEPHGKQYILAPMDPMEFYFTEHTVIAKTIVDMITAGEKVDYLTVASKLLVHGDLDRIGGPTYTKKLVDSVPSLENALYYRDSLLDLAHIRKMGRAAYDAFGMSTRPGPTAADIEKTLTDGLQSVEQDEGAVSAFQLALELLQDMDKKKAPPVPHSGLFELDGLLWGFQPSTMYTIAARMSVGKTSLLSWIAMSAAQERFPFLYISMEMSRKMIGLRMVSAIAKVDLTKYVSYELTDDDLKRTIEAKQKLSELPIYFASCAKRTVDEVILTLRREKLIHNIRVAGVDYLQLLHDGKQESRVNELDSISGKLKGIADELEIALICVVTANRASLKEGRGVSVGDVRGSDSIAYDADVAIALDRNEERTNASGNFLPEGVDKVDLKVVKNRNGKTGDTVCFFDKRYQRWMNQAPEV